MKKTTNKRGLPKREYQRQKLERKLSSFLGLVQNVGSLIRENFTSEQNLCHKDTIYTPYLTNLGKHRGLRDMLRISKETRLYVTRYLSGVPLKVKSVNVPLTKDWLPASIGSDLLRIARRGSTAEKRGLLTVLYSTRALELTPSPDYESITAPNRSEKLAKLHAEMTCHRTQFGRDLGLWRKCVPSKIHFKQFHLTTNQGPNGHGLYSWGSDLKCLPSNLITSLKTFAGPELTLRIEHLLCKQYSKFGDYCFKTKYSGNYRKIVAIPDKEGKTRVIAIGDYFSQTALKPFHTYLFGVLRKIPQDCTFDQSSFLKKLPKREGHLYHSMDLSNATDRFPIDTISLMLLGHFDPAQIKAWKEIMVGFPFLIKTTGEFISYAVGNPMGFYSSGSSFTLAHHFVMYIACKRNNIKGKDACYVILGDDIVIHDDNLASSYREIMNDLGVEISANKTHVSEHTYEFAKRGIHHGEEISPFPIAGGREVCKRYNLSINFLQTIATKGGISTKGIVNVITGGYTLDKKPNRFRKVIKSRAAICEIVTSVMRGELQGVQAINLLVQLKENRDFEYKLTDENANYIFQRACMEAFVETNDPKSNAKGKPLGLFAQSLVEMMTREDAPFMDANPRGLNLISPEREVQDEIYDPTGPYYVPPLNVYGTIEEMYLKLNRTAWEIDTFRNGDGPLLMRAMTIPNSDQAFLIRNKDVLPMASANISKRIYNNLEEFRQIKRMYPGL